MARTRWKFFFIHPSLFRVLIRNNLKKIKIINVRGGVRDDKQYKFNYKTRVRSTTVTKHLTQNTFSTINIYKGLFYKQIELNSLCIGHKLGEFSFTRKPFYFPKKEPKQKNKFLRR